jgi:hypothetical protein
MTHHTTGEDRSVSGERQMAPILSAAETADRLEAWAREMLASTPPKTGALHLLDAVHYLRTAAPTVPSTAMGKREARLAAALREARDFVGKNYCPAGLRARINAALATPPAQPKNLCDCERSHNGLGMAGRECDCPARNPPAQHPEDRSSRVAGRTVDAGAWFDEALEQSLSIDVPLAGAGAMTAPSTAAGERERLEEERNRLSNHFGYGARLDGSTRDRIAAIDARLAALATPPAQGVEEETETLENLIDAAIGARTTPPWQEQAAQIRRDALEEAARICRDEAMLCRRDMRMVAALSAETCAYLIRALLSKPAKGEGK